MIFGTKRPVIAMEKVISVLERDTAPLPSCQGFIFLEDINYKIHNINIQKGEKYVKKYFEKKFP